MNRNNIDVRLLVKGRPITEYFHNGNYFVEGRDGHEFEIEIINNNPFRALAIVSVDGRSVLDGKEASDQSPGYLFEANQTIRIPGWKLDDATVAKFFFAGKKSGKTYEQQMTGSAQNGGVVGVMAYREKARSPVNHAVFRSALPSASPGYTPQWWSYTGGVTGDFAIGGIASGPITSNVCSSSMCATSSTPDAEVYTSTASQPRRIQTSPFSPKPETLNNLGTGFGEAATFETRAAQFERGDLLTVAILYYDNARGLKARGIQVGRPSRVRFNQAPQAFPGMQGGGCTPPAGWNG